MCPYKMKKLSVYWEDDTKTQCEMCHNDEGKFILVVDMGKTEKDQNFEREEYYCIDCFKQLVRS